MAVTNRISHRLVLLLSLALCGGGAFAAYSETRSYLNGGMTSQEHFTALATGEHEVGLSLASTRLVLDNCYEAMTNIYGKLQPKSRRDATASTCLALSEDITRTMPSHSYAWYIGGLAASQVKNYAALADHLHQSQLTGPTEQWLAELRSRLAEDNLDRLPKDVRLGNDNDLGLLVTSYRGVASIAQRYVDDPSFRERITTIVEQLPPDEQRRFIANVETVASQTGAPR